MVTERMQPLRIGSGSVHVIGMPYHLGPSGLVTGDVGNDLIGVALDPNVRRSTRPRCSPATCARAARAINVQNQRLHDEQHSRWLRARVP